MITWEDFIHIYIYIYITYIYTVGLVCGYVMKKTTFLLSGTNNNNLT